MNRKIKIVPDIKKRINRQLELLDLKAKESLDEAIKIGLHFYTSYCLKSDGSKYIFKARISDEYFACKSFANEVNATLFFSQIPEIKKHVVFRNVYDWGLTARLDWAVYEFLQGKVVTEEKVHQKIINSIVKALVQLQSVPVSIVPVDIYHFDGIFSKIWFKDIFWHDNDYTRYKKQLKIMLPHLKRIIKCDEKILEFFRKNKKLINESEKVLAHGDFDLNNILLSNSKIFFIDWERIRIANRAFDLSNMYTRLSASWRNDLLRTFIKKAPNPTLNRKLFRLMVILQCLYKIHPAYYYKEVKGGKIDIKAIEDWNQTILKALDSFDALLK